MGLLAGRERGRGKLGESFDSEGMVCAPVEVRAVR